MNELQNINLMLEAIYRAAMLCGLPLVVGLWLVVALLGLGRGK